MFRSVHAFVKIFSLTSRLLLLFMNVNQEF